MTLIPPKEKVNLFAGDEEANHFGNDLPMLPITNPNKDLGRNDPCPCGSGKKYKKYCLP